MNMVILTEILVNRCAAGQRCGFLGDAGIDTVTTALRCYRDFICLFTWPRPQEHGGLLVVLLPQVIDLWACSSKRICYAESVLCSCVDSIKNAFKFGDYHSLALHAAGRGATNVFGDDTFVPSMRPQPPPCSKVAEDSPQDVSETEPVSDSKIETSDDNDTDTVNYTENVLVHDSNCSKTADNANIDTADDTNTETGKDGDKLLVHESNSETVDNASIESSDHTNTETLVHDSHSETVDKADMETADGTRTETVDDTGRAKQENQEPETMSGQVTAERDNLPHQTCDDQTEEALQHQLTLPTSLTKDKNRTHGPVSQEFFQESLEKLTKTLSDSHGVSKQETRGDKTDKNDNSVMKILAPRTIRFAPRVEEQVYKAEELHGDVRQFRLESVRLASFDRNSKVEACQEVWVLRLASAGFYCPQPDSSTVSCAFCGLKIALSGHVMKRPMDVHRRQSPACPLVSGTSDNVPLDLAGRQAGKRFIDQYLGGSGGGPSPSPGRTAWRGGASPLVAPAPLPVLQDNSPPVPRPPTPPPVQDTSSPVSHTSSPVAHTRSPVPLTSPPVHPTSPSVHTSSPSVHPTAPSVHPTAPSVHPTAPSVHPSSPSVQPSLPSVHPASPAVPNPTPPAVPDPQPQSSGGEGGTRQTVTYAQLGIYTQEPKRPDFAIASTRANSFTDAGWPHPLDHPPDVMAEAGMYFVGVEDLVRCFYCKGGLKGWGDQLNAWVEHARFFPTCPFVGQVKGQEFIDVVQRLKAIHEYIPLSEVEEELALAEQAQAQEMQESASLPDVEEDVGASGGADGAVGGTEDTRTVLNDLSKAVEALETENQEIKDVRVCKICQTNEVSILFLPCGHLVSCAQCAPALRNCAICRQRVKGRVRVVD